MLTTRAHHNQVGIAVVWATEYMVGPAGPLEPTVAGLREVFDLAGRTRLFAGAATDWRSGGR
jgi:hypothetical protein